MTRSPFQAAHRLEHDYFRKLRQISTQVDHLIKGFGVDNILRSAAEVQQALRRYAELIKPWASVIASRMLEEVQARDRRAWQAVSKNLNRDLRQALATAPTGETLRTLLAEQVALITSLPLEAAQRVHELTLYGVAEGKRATYVAAEILRTGEIAEGRARCIARTEVARTASNLTQVRATHVGSTHYIWRTAGDADVREDHKKLNGKVIAWDEPPIADVSAGLRAHAGCIYNCRCYPEPIITDED